MQPNIYRLFTTSTFSIGKTNKYIVAFSSL